MVRAISTLTLLAVMSLPLPVHGASWTTDGLDDYWITRWDPTPEMPGVFLTMAQDRDGYLWLGSADGLFRFDGFTFQRWSEINAAPLAGTVVRTLFVDPAGRLWVGFDEGGISRIQGREVRNYSKADGLPVASVRALVQDSGGMLWLGSLAGLYIFDGGHWIPHPTDRGLSQSRILSAMLDATGSLYVTTPDAIFRRRSGDAVFEPVSSQQVGTGAAQSLCKDLDGHIVISDPTHGFRIVGSGSNEHLLTSDTETGTGLRVTCSRNGTIWVGTRLTGLWRLPRTGSGSTHVRTGLLAQGATALFEDRDQNIWVGTSAGLYRLTPRNVRTVLDAATVVATDQAGRAWVGATRGLLQFVRKDDSWQRAATYLERTHVLSVHVDSNDIVWAATDAGIVRLQPGAPPVTPSWGREFRQVTSMTSNAGGTLWFYDERRGLYRVRAGTLQQLDPPHEVQGAGTRVLHADRRDRLWLVEDAVQVRGPDGDVRTYTAADGLERVAYRSLYEDSSGVIWLGSTVGLSRVVDDRIETVAIPRLRGSSWVKSIVEDRQGQLWLGIDRGGIRLTRASFENAVRTPRRALTDGFQVFDGLPGIIRATSDSVSVRTTDGELWFTTDEGLAIVDPETASSDLGPVPARIVAARADDMALDAANSVRLRAGTSRLQITWAALDLKTPDRVRFRYRLDGFDRDWIDAGARHQTEYTNLPPGSYIFRVGARREGNAWTDSLAAAWELSVAPRFYQTVWFPFATAAAVAIALWASWHIRLMQVRRRFTITLAERARVSREVHDTLLQSLVGVALQCQVLADSVDVPAVRERLTRLRSRIDGHIGEARELIWNLRSPMLERHDLVTALRRVADDVVEGTPVTVDVQTAGRVCTCSPHVERELLRIAQEAVTNAVRHGCASLVTIELHFEERNVRLTIRDNGRGFTPPETITVADGHCGLAMMRERAEEVGGRLFIASRPAHGASIEAMVPLFSGESRG